MTSSTQGTPVNVARLQTVMREAGLDAVVLVTPENVIYAAGIHFVMSDLYHFMETRDAYATCVVPASGPATLLVWRQEQELAQQTSWVKDIRSWTSFQGTAGLLIDVLREKRLERAKIGVEKLYLPVALFEELTQALPQASFVAGEPALSRARMIKSAEEVEILSDVALLTSKAIHLAWERARTEDRERDVCEDITHHVMRFGAQPHVFNYGSGPNSALGHRWGDDRRLQPGDIIHADAKGRLRGYWSDVSRNCVVGEPSSHQADVYRRLVAIHDRIVERLRPGVAASEIYEFSRRAYQEEGINVEPRLIGHGIGTSLHETPLLEPHCKELLAEGMVVTVEPTHYEPGVRYHYENMVLVSPTGGRVLSHYGTGPELYIIR
jgi:Xaa-Pro aminopeptidase